MTSLRDIWDHCYDVVVNHFADFSGTATRREFWTFYAARFIVGIALLVIPVIGILANLVLLVPTLGIGARRLHEARMSGWFQLLNLVPVIGWIILFILLCLPPKSPVNY